MPLKGVSKPSISRAGLLSSGTGLCIAAAFGTRTGAIAANDVALIKIGAGQIDPQAEAYYAQEMGFFKKHGLTTSVSTLMNGAAIAAAVASGDLQIGISNVLQLAQASSHDLPFVVIATGGVHAPNYHVSGLVVAAGSPIASAKDLDGKVVGVATLNGLDQMAASVFIDKNGGNSKAVKFIEVPHAAIVDTLTAGRIDAANIEDPDLSAALARKRVRSLGDGEAAIAPSWAETAWFSTKNWLAGNKDSAARFAAAIYEAGAWAMENPDPAAVVLQKYLGRSREKSSQRFATSMKLADFDAVLDAAAAYHLIPPTKASSFVWDSKQRYHAEESAFQR
jgi:NitT/TauT family transport system substrate-binding protein